MSPKASKYKPDVVFPPGETLQETLEAMDMPSKKLAERTGLTAKYINEITRGRAIISEETALRLEKVLGIDASFWRNLEHQYQRFLAEQSER
jgi:HTH-type transcriptional regulator/antitoxin HigA